MASASGRSSQPSFGALLRQFRRAVGYSQEELAERAGVSLAAVSALERETRRAPQRQTLLQLCAGLQLSDEDATVLSEAAARSRARTGRARATDMGTDRSRSVNLPNYITSFVGRTDEVRDLQVAFGSRRLITIVGAGGIGKTRLACEVASLAADDFDRVVFADLAPLIDGSLIAPYLAGLLRAGNDRDGHVGALDAVGDILAAERALLVFDNCERVIASAAEIVVALLQRCRELRILTTSRERLAVYGEGLFWLQPFSVPEEGLSDVAAAASNSAIALFVDRARIADPGFALDSVALPDAVDICRRLDGIPLAIELIAARLQALGMNALRTRLEQQFSFGAGYRDVPARHQTMYAAIGWSFDLLDAQERTLLERVAMFVGGFTRDAVEIVCADDELPAAQIGETLVRLFDKSLVQVQHRDDASRYSLLEPVRSYGLERLHSNVTFEMIAMRHSTWIAEAADAADAEAVLSFSERTIMHRMAVEIDNIRSALKRLLGSGREDEVVLAARILSGLRTVWMASDGMEEAMRLAEEILPQLSVARHARLASRVALTLGQTVVQPLDAATMHRIAPIFAAAGDDYAFAMLSTNAILQSVSFGEIEQAETYRRDVEPIFKRSESLREWHHENFLAACAYLDGAIGRFDEARSTHREVVARFGTSPIVLQIGAMIEAFAGNYSAAIEMLANNLESLTAWPALHDQTYVNLAVCFASSGQWSEARAAVRHALESQASRFGIFIESVSIAAAVVAHDGELEAAAHLKGFAEAHTRKSVFERGRIYRRLGDGLDRALLAGLSAKELERALATGADLSTPKARALAASL